MNIETVKALLPVEMIEWDAQEADYGLQTIIGAITPRGNKATVTLMAWPPADAGYEKVADAILIVRGILAQKAVITARTNY